jgi:hypothetical protein
VWLEARLKFRSQIILLFVINELDTLPSGLIEIVTMAEPFADLRKSSAEDVLLNEMTVCSGDWKDVHTPFIEQWNPGGVQESIRHFRSTAGMFDGYTRISAETNVAPTI